LVIRLTVRLKELRKRTFRDGNPKESVYIALGLPIGQEPRGYRIAYDLLS
jgi:hypothetical protein